MALQCASFINDEPEASSRCWHRAALGDTMATKRIDQLTAHPKSTTSPLATASQLMLRDGALSSDNTRKVGLSDMRGGALFVTDFGAVGDGVADDTAAIQAALNAAVNGTHIFFPRGAYKIT